MIAPKMGTSRPTVGSPLAGLAGALFGPVQQRVLALLFGQPERRFGSAEIIRHASSGTGGTHRQLQRLEAVGLIIATRVGNQKFYQANPDSPIFSELHGLVVKTVGVVEPLRRALAKLSPKIRAAFVFGSVAKRQDRADSDLDLMVISDRVDYPTVYKALAPAEEVLARAVNPTVMTTAEWAKKRNADDSFARRVAEQPKLFVLGDEDALG